MMLSTSPRQVDPAALEEEIKVECSGEEVSYRQCIHKVSMSVTPANAAARQAVYTAVRTRTTRRARAMASVHCSLPMNVKVVSRRAGDSRQRRTAEDHLLNVKLKHNGGTSAALVLEKASWDNLHAFARKSQANRPTRVPGLSGCSHDGQTNSTVRISDSSAEPPTSSTSSRSPGDEVECMEDSPERLHELITSAFVSQATTKSGEPGADRSRETSRGGLQEQQEISVSLGGESPAQPAGSSSSSRSCSTLRKERVQKEEDRNPNRQDSVAPSDTRNMSGPRDPAEANIFSICFSQRHPTIRLRHLDDGTCRSQPVDSNNKHASSSMSESDVCGLGSEDQIVRPSPTAPTCSDTVPGVKCGPGGMCYATGVECPAQATAAEVAGFACRASKSLEGASDNRDPFDDRTETAQLASDGNGYTRTACSYGPRSDPPPSLACGFEWLQQHARVDISCCAPIFVKPKQRSQHLYSSGKSLPAMPGVARKRPKGWAGQRSVHKATGKQKRAGGANLYKKTHRGNGKSVQIDDGLANLVSFWQKEPLRRRSNVPLPSHSRSKKRNPYLLSSSKLAVQGGRCDTHTSRWGWVKAWVLRPLLWVRRNEADTDGESQYYVQRCALPRSDGHPIHRSGFWRRPRSYGVRKKGLCQTHSSDSEDDEDEESEDDLSQVAMAIHRRRWHNGSGSGFAKHSPLSLRNHDASLLSAPTAPWTARKFPSFGPDPKLEPYPPSESQRRCLRQTSRGIAAGCDHFREGVLAMDDDEGKGCKKGGTCATLCRPWSRIDPRQAKIHGEQSHSGCRQSLWRCQGREGGKSCMIDSITRCGKCLPADVNCPVCRSKNCGAMVPVPRCSDRNVSGTANVELFSELSDPCADVCVRPTKLCPCRNCPRKASPFGVMRSGGVDRPISNVHMVHRDCDVENSDLRLPITSRLSSLCSSCQRTRGQHSCRVFSRRRLQLFLAAFCGIGSRAVNKRKKKNKKMGKKSESLKEDSARMSGRGQVMASQVPVRPESSVFLDRSAAKVAFIQQEVVSGADGADDIIGESATSEYLTPCSSISPSDQMLNEGMYSNRSSEYMTPCSSISASELMPSESLHSHKSSDCSQPFLSPRSLFSLPEVPPSPEISRAIQPVEPAAAGGGDRTTVSTSAGPASSSSIPADHARMILPNGLSMHCQSNNLRVEMTCSPGRLEPAQEKNNYATNMDCNEIVKNESSIREFSNPLIGLGLNKDYFDIESDQQHSMMESLLGRQGNNTGEPLHVPIGQCGPSSQTDRPYELGQSDCSGTVSGHAAEVFRRQLSGDDTTLINVDADDDSAASTMKEHYNFVRIWRESGDFNQIEPSDNAPAWSALSNQYLIYRPVPEDVGTVLCYVIRNRISWSDTLYTLYTQVHSEASNIFNVSALLYGVDHEREHEMICKFARGAQRDRESCVPAGAISETKRHDAGSTGEPGDAVGEDARTRGERRSWVPVGLQMDEIRTTLVGVGAWSRCLVTRVRSSAVRAADEMAASVPRGSALVRFFDGIKRVLKAPWRVTGPASGPEFLDSVKDAGEYRPFAPATPPKEVIIPHAETDHVYNIKYYERDSRRAATEAPKKLEVIEPAKADLAAELETADLPPTPGKYYVMGTAHHINDVPHGGYQR
ncbi:hypothetical protein CBR_g37656 [Chara braunii]|uniref:Uncharacterized protein n=1 Tax=Chara braunii TaxID=69332 RepID=A0A388LNG3_CHABU|nr:hypothetical protein CBR_g37656 [Chara braunii]|eukprot:GBG83858.1 hypothetical protein CBR_g37656 [Chara braunii]